MSNVAELVSTDDQFFPLNSIETFTYFELGNIPPELDISEIHDTDENNQKLNSGIHDVSGDEEINDSDKRRDGNETDKVVLFLITQSERRHPQYHFKRNDQNFFMKKNYSGKSHIQWCAP